MKRVLFYLFSALLFCPSVLLSQNFISVGARISYSVYNSVWKLEDPAITRLYPDKPEFFNAYIGVYGEFLGRKSLSTFADISYHNTNYTFEYGMKNTTGEVTGTNKINSTVQYISILLQEKIRYGREKGPQVFFKAGPRVELEIKSNIDKDFQYVFKDAKPVIIGYTLTGGAEWNFSTFRIGAECFWHGDITKTYSSAFGKIQNNSLGISLTAGWLNKKND